MTTGTSWVRAPEALCSMDWKGWVGGWLSTVPTCRMKSVWAAWERYAVSTGCLLFGLTGYATVSLGWRFPEVSKQRSVLIYKRWKFINTHPKRPESSGVGLSQLTTTCSLAPTSTKSAKERTAWMSKVRCLKQVWSRWVQWTTSLAPDFINLTCLNYRQE